MINKFAKNIKTERENKHISQSKFSELIGVTPQAVSKWECGQSTPDMETVCRIADILEVSLDYLVGRTYTKEVLTELPDDNILRVVQCVGRQLLSKEKYDSQIFIPLSINGDAKMNVHIWGSTKIDGDIEGDVCSEMSIFCGNIAGNVTAKRSINCGNVGGDLSAGGAVNCGNVGGDACPNGGMNCGNVSGDACPVGDLNCGDIEGNVSCNKDVHCQKIKGGITSAQIVYVEKQKQT